MIEQLGKPGNSMRTLNRINTVKSYLAVLTLITAVSSSLMAASIPVTLTSGNTTAIVDVGTQAGMDFWSVNGPSGQNQLQQQWFWYRVGTGPQLSIDNISAPSWSQTPNTLTTTYANSAFSVSIMYTLNGGGTGQGDIQEGINIHNFNANSPLSISFYQYSHFTLLGNAGGANLVMDNGTAYQSAGATSIAESIVAPTASFFEANTTGGTTSTLYKLNNTSGLNLNDSGSASGDVTWAFQWNFSVPNSGDQQITKDKLLDITFVPEPSVIGFIAAGLGIHLLRRRSRV